MKEVAVPEAVDLAVTAVHEQLRPLGDALVDEVADTLPALTGDYRARLDAVLHAVTHAPRACRLGDELRGRFPGLTNRDGNRGGQAALTGAAEGAVGQDSCSHPGIGVGEDDGGILCSTLA